MYLDIFFTRLGLSPTLGVTLDHFLDVSPQFAQGDLKSSSQFVRNVDADLYLAELDRTDVGAMNPSLCGKRFLGYCQPFPPSPDSTSKKLLDFLHLG